MRRRTAALFALPLLAIALAACSGGGTPSAGGSPGASSSGGSASYEQEFDDWNLKFAKCLRDQGMDVADPEPGTQWTYPDDPGAEAAVNTCMSTVGNAPINPNQPSKKEISDELMERAKCLRDKGFDVPDPGADGSWDLPENLFDEARACAK